MFRWVGGLSLPVAVGAFAALACSPAPESETITFGRSGAPGGQWPVHGGDTGHTQYAALDQINADNIADLEIVWRWKSPDVQLRETQEELQSGGIFRHEATPLMVDGVLYVSTSLGQVVALDPWTGETIWSYDPELWRAGSPTNLGFLTRGVAHWTDGNDAKIFYAGGANATLVSIDAKTGAPDPQFGDGGKVDLTARLGPHVSSSNYTVTSPPVVTRDVVIVGSSIQDTPIRREAPPGDVRAFDVRTGELRWTFHTIPREGEFGVETWEDESWKTAGSVNVWTMMSVDEELGYVYLPLGTASHNWYGGHRPGDNLFATSLVCLDATTGERVWHFQFIHHPIWDWDLPAAPTLIDIEVDGEPIRAVAQVTKQGFLFVFDRVTGEPVWPIEERPVPQSDLPGETASPTQPFPTKPAPFERQGFTEDELIDFTPELRAEALEILADVDGGPLYAPPSTRGTLVNPGWAGGGNWNGAAFDPETQILYVPSWTDWNLVILAEPQRANANFDYLWGGRRVPDVQGLPLFKPPYGRITAIDMKTGEHLWQVANGDGPRSDSLLEHLDLPPLGTRVESFPLLTKTLLFATTNGDGWNPPTLRVFDKTTGDVLREIELPSSVHATPMTYLLEGKQFVVVAIGGRRDPDELVALALR